MMCICPIELGDQIGEVFPYRDIMGHRLELSHEVFLPRSVHDEDTTAAAECEVRRGTMQDGP